MITKEKKIAKTISLMPSTIELLNKWAARFGERPNVFASKIISEKLVELEYLSKHPKQLTFEDIQKKTT